MKKILKLLLSLVLILILTSILILGYLGFIPGLSHLFGSDKPKNLGIETTSENLDSANLKITSFMASGTSNISDVSHTATDIYFTSGELTSLVSEKLSKEKIVENLQIKINDDSVVEISGIFNFNKLPKVVQDQKFEQILKNIKNSGVFNDSMPFYVRGQGSIKNNEATIIMLQAQVGRLNLPITDDINQVAKNLTNKNAQFISGLSVRSASFDKGSLHLVGF